LKPHISLFCSFVLSISVFISCVAVLLLTDYFLYKIIVLSKESKTKQMVATNINKKNNHHSLSTQSPTTYIYDVKNSGFGWEHAQKYSGVKLINEISAFLS
jgi:hypothetical protein